MTDFLTVKKLSDSTSESRGTSLITMYIPECDNNSLSLVVNKLESELGTATNIKSKVVKKDVIHAIKSAIYFVRNCVNKYSENGIVICTGITDKKYCL